MAAGLILRLCLVVLLASSAPFLIGQEVKPEQNDVLAAHPGPFVKTLAVPVPIDREGHRLGKRSGAITISYDDGILTALPTVQGLSYGNQFNSASGDPVSSFSVTMLSFYLAAPGTDNVFVTVFGAVNGTTAPVLGSVVVTPDPPGAVVSVTVGPYTGTGSFLAGVFFAPGDTIVLGSGTANGQGHHGMVINDIVGTGFQTLPGLNAVIGATTAFIPVELMDFKVTDE